MSVHHIFTGRALLSGTTVDFLEEFSELAGNVRGVAIQNWSVTGTNLTRVVENDDLSVERFAAFGGVVLGVSTDVPSSDFLDRDVLDVESNVVARKTLDQSLVVHLNTVVNHHVHGSIPLDFSGDIRGSEGHNHTSLDNTGFNSADRDCSNTTDLVDILERKAEGLIGRSDGGLDGINGLKEGESLVRTSLGFLRPALKPRHVGGLLNHVVAVPAGDGDEGN